MVNNLGHRGSDITYFKLDVMDYILEPVMSSFLKVNRWRFEGCWPGPPGDSMCFALMTPDLSGNHLIHFFEYNHIKTSSNIVVPCMYIWIVFWPNELY